jgi:hypothetical protein
MTEDSHNDAGLVFILSGSLVMSQRNENEGTDERVLYAAFAVSARFVNEKNRFSHQKFLF